MTTAAPHANPPARRVGPLCCHNPPWCSLANMTTALDDVADAYADRAILAARLAAQNAHLGDVVRRARAEAHPWKDIAQAAGTSEVAVYNALRKATS